MAQDSLPAWMRLILCWPIIIAVIAVPYLLIQPDIYFINVSQQPQYIACLPGLMCVMALHVAIFLFMTRYQLVFSCGTTGLFWLVAIIKWVTDPDTVVTWDYTYFAIWNTLALYYVSQIYRNDLTHRAGTYFRFYAAVLISTTFITCCVYLLAAIRAAWWPVEGQEPQGFHYIISLLRELAFGHSFENGMFMRFHLPLFIEGAVFVFGLFLWRSINLAIPEIPQVIKKTNEDAV